MYTPETVSTPKVMCEVQNGWIARDGDGSLYFHAEEPAWNERTSEWMGRGLAIALPRHLFPQVMPEDAPLPVKFSIKPQGQ